MYIRIPMPVNFKSYSLCCKTVKHGHDKLVGKLHTESPPGDLPSIEEK